MRRAVLVLALCASFALRAEDTSPQILEVSLNQRNTHQSVTFWTGEGGALTASTDDWKALGVVLSTNEASQTRLNTTQLGATFKVNEDTQGIDIELPLERLPKQDLSRVGNKRVIAPNAKALLINYDLAFTKTFPGNYEGASLAHDLHYPMFGGVLSTSGQLNTNTTLGTQYRRQYTTWEKDNYNSLQSIQIGDVFAIGSTSSNANLAGIRWAKDPIGLDPLTPQYPLPMLNGYAVDAGTLEVLANQTAVKRSDIEKGPFQIDRLQLQPGLNSMQTVVQDGYGRQSTVGIGSFYVAPTLLRPGLDTFDLSVGLIRHGFGDTYKGLGANFRYSKGISDSTTWSIQTQAAGDGENLTGTLIRKLGNAGVVTTTLGLSNANSAQQKGTGWYGSVGYDYRAENWGIHFQRYQQSDNFWVLHDPTLLAYQPKSSTLIGGSWNSENRAFSASLNYNDLKTSYTHYRQVLGNLAWNRGRNHLMLSGGYDLAHHSPSAMVTYSYAFMSGGVSASAGIYNSQQQEQLSGYWTHVGADTLTQLNAQAYESGQNRFADVSGTFMTNKGQGRFTFESTGQTNQLSGDWSGGILVSSGGVNFMKYSPQGYALIDVGVPKIPVTFGGKVMGTTNSNGVAVIGGLQPLVPVQIGLQDKNIPLGVDIEDTSKMVTIAKAGGAVVPFKVNTVDARAFHVVSNGKDIEMGATTEGGDPIGFNGQLYLEHPPIGKTITIQRKDGSTCKAVFPSKLPAYGGVTDIECN